MGFNPLSPTAWKKKKEDGSREVAETMPLCLSPVEADSPGNPDASEGLRISGHSPSLRGSASSSRKAISVDTGPLESAFIGT